MQAGAMDVTTTVAPATEPVSLVEAKRHLRVDGTADDAEITAKILQARAAVESFTRLRLITQTVQVTLDHFDARVVLPVWPVQEVLSVAYDDAAGVERTFADWRLVLSTKPRAVVPAYAASWPVTRDQPGAVRVTVRCGFGDDGAAVPQDLRAALLMRLSSLYDLRADAVVGATVQEMPLGARALMLPHVFY